MTAPKKKTGENATTIMNKKKPAVVKLDPRLKTRLLAGRFQNKT